VLWLTSSSYHHVEDSKIVVGSSLSVVPDDLKDRDAEAHLFDVQNHDHAVEVPLAIQICFRRGALMDIVARFAAGVWSCGCGVGVLNSATGLEQVE